MSFNPFPFSKDIGSPQIEGKTQFDNTNQQFILDAGGYNIWFERDEFHFTYDTISGDFMKGTLLISRLK